MAKHIQLRGKSAGAIALSVERAMHHGSLGAGQPLPTIRELAATLRVSPVTVAAAYRVLQTRGLVVGDGRRGTRVRPQPATAARSISISRLSEGVVDLATGNPDPAWLPPIVPALRTLDYGPHLYGDPIPFRPLVTFAAGEFAADGIPASAVAVVSGALDAIDRLLREHLRPGDRVAVEDPTLPGLLDLLGARGLRAEPCAVDAEGAIPPAFEQALRRHVRAVIVTGRAQNPTGAAMTAPRAVDLKRLLRRHREVLLIENDPAGPVAGVPAVTLCDGSHPLWAVVRSTSKFLGPDLRVAVVAGDELTIARLEGRQALGVRWVSHLLQGLALALWSDPSSARRLARAADVYTQRRTALLHALASRGVQAHGASGFNIWIPVHEETATVQALADRGWAVAAGERFRLRAGPAIRVTTSALSVEEAPHFAADVEPSVRPMAAALA